MGSVKGKKKRLIGYVSGMLEGMYAVATREVKEKREISVIDYTHEIILCTDVEVASNARIGRGYSYISARINLSTVWIELFN